MTNFLHTDFAGPDGERDLLDILSLLNAAASTMNRLPLDDISASGEALAAIADSAAELVTGSSTIVCAYDALTRSFDPARRAGAGPLAAFAPHDAPRDDGLGMRAVNERRPILSYERSSPPIHAVLARAGARSGACLPLVYAGQVTGVLYVYLSEKRAFADLELLLLDNIANQAAATLYHLRRLAEVQGALARREDELQRLRRAGLLISSRLRLEETLEAILEMALEVTNAHYGIFRLVDRSGRFLEARAVAASGLDQPVTEPLAIDGTSIMGWVAVHRQPLLIPDLRAGAWAHIYIPLDRQFEMRSEVAVPLIGAAGRLEGVLNLESPLRNQFGEADSHLLQSLATQAVIAIQQARLLDALQEITGRLLVQPCQEVLERIVTLACDLLNAPSSAIWVREKDELALRAGCGPWKRGDRIPLQDSLIGQALSSGQAVAYAGLPGAGGTVGNLVALGPYRTGPALVVPLLAGHGQPIGAFSVSSRGPSPDQWIDSEWDKKVLLILSHYAALALENATRQEALRVSQEQRSVAETFAAMGDIAANLLHHVNNKVGTIPVRVEGIQDKYEQLLAANPYLASNLAQIEQSATEAMAAVRESLDVLRPIEKTVVSVAPCVAQAVTTARLPAGVRVKTRGLAELPAVLVGPESLMLVIVNLLHNAADAMAGRGTVTISGTSLDDFVEIEVSDTGPGIPPELHERIFEFNFSGRRRDSHKLGFGLWWVKTLVARLGGSIAVESDGQHGTSFQVRLPMASEVSDWHGE